MPACGIGADKAVAIAVQVEAAGGKVVAGSGGAGQAPLLAIELDELAARGKAGKLLEQQAPLAPAAQAELADQLLVSGFAAGGAGDAGHQLAIGHKARVQSWRGNSFGGGPKEPVPWAGLAILADGFRKTASKQTNAVPGRGCKEKNCLHTRACAEYTTRASHCAASFPLLLPRHRFSPRLRYIHWPNIDGLREIVVAQIESGAH